MRQITSDEQVSGLITANGVLFIASNPNKQISNKSSSLNPVLSTKSYLIESLSSSSHDHPHVTATTCHEIRILAHYVAFSANIKTRKATDGFCRIIHKSVFENIFKPDLLKIPSPLDFFHSTMHYFTHFNELPHNR